jgi:hypothetical protein
MQWIAEIGGRGPEARAEAGFAAQCLALSETVAKRLGSGDDEIAELERGRRPGLHRALARDAQQADRFNDAAGLFRDRRGLARQQLPSGHFGIDRIALADPTTSVGVRLVDLRHLDVSLSQVAHQGGGVAAGGLHSDRVDRAETLKPLERLGVADRGGREARVAQQRASLVQSGEVMSIGVSVDSADDDRRLLRHAVHGCPSCPGSGGLVGKGGQNSDEAL